MCIDALDVPQRRSLRQTIGWLHVADGVRGVHGCVRRSAAPAEVSALWSHLLPELPAAAFPVPLPLVQEGESMLHDC